MDNDIGDAEARDMTTTLLLAEDAARIRTVRGVGYRIEAP